MDVILHIGAHRTATTSFQAYLRLNAQLLAAQGIAVWGPRRTRAGLFSGLWPDPGMPAAPNARKRVAGRIALALNRAEAQGIRTVIVTDENMLGTPRLMIRAGSLYPDAAARLQLLVQVFGGRVTGVALSIRTTDAFWSSLVAMTLARGHPVPGPARLQAMADAARGWRAVITEVSAALDCPLAILPHEIYGALPERRLARILPGPLTPPTAHARLMLNRAPDLPELRKTLALAGGCDATLPQGDGRYRPFSAAQAAALQEQYADDLFWLAAGADGLAQLMTEKSPMAEGKTPARVTAQRGQDDDPQGHVAQAG